MFWKPAHACILFIGVHHLKLSVHLHPSLPRGFFPSMTPLIHLFVHLLSFTPSFHFHSSCLLLTVSNTPLCPCFCKISTFGTWFFQHTPSILLRAFICMTWIFDFRTLCNTYVSHPHNTGINFALTIFSLVCLTSSLLLNTVLLITFMIL